ncbi:DUF1622 domain-containing protein [Clostridium perfringens]|uniref:DUF1622 domain-containing protein n=1 Tax=Clostridium perfringens TaxID=1502 RepID=UPI0013E39CE6|nr:DUF1622 domain-containing protein [Clostridium perfringens]MDK0634362.1 DUF1622 domain-containing protein [Clostridium perfringens]MDK2999154.1 DUF1622 domain-containing protein [Clostridium perfringens]MDK3222864.1 DUF1622 domain-containing protein [Clostridium perfringens]MDM0829356.1 DUF1622 domain-containing protein [Clostridium perfringens]MDM0831823.1 DUF1622 domain-containing protein [Clostridium perfringens]
MKEVISLVHKTLEWLILILQGISVTVIIYGVLLTIFKFFKIEFSKKNRILKVKALNKAKNFLGSYILLGLEILVCSGIILSILKPTLYDILLLGSTVTLRTVISYFLKKELKSSNGNSNLKEENS